MSAQHPIVGITADIIEKGGVERAAAGMGYITAVRASGGVPMVLPPVPELALEQLALCDAVVLTGGDDPRTESFGEPTDPRVTPVRAERQAAESAMIGYLAVKRPDTPVLGVCLGMQMMALHAGGRLDQFMPDSTPTHAEHWNASHEIRTHDTGWISDGRVHSKHKQAVADAGEMSVVGLAHDGVIEAIVQPERRFYLGVQWHPERTQDDATGLDLFRRLVRSVRPSAR